MKNFMLNMLLLMLGNIGISQELPNCIKNLSKKTGITTISFVRVLKLKGDRTVYEFAVGSAPRCMDCSNGTMFYDENCNVIASFIMGRGPSAYVNYGYTALELGKGSYRDVKYNKELPGMPICLSKSIANIDSLNKFGVVRVLQVSIKNQILYYFEHAVPKEKVNCKDCSSTFKYYDENCKLVATFTVGGIAGAKASEGFTPTDFYNKRTLQILYNKK